MPKINPTQIEKLSLKDEHISEKAKIALRKLAETVFKADGTEKATGNFDLNGNRIKNLAPAIELNDAISRDYFEKHLTALVCDKGSVLVATNSNIDLFGEQDIDGVSVVSGKKVLVKEQNDPAENGIYISSAGGWARVFSCNTGERLKSAMVLVEEGSINKKKIFLQTSTNIELGVTPIIWEKFFEPFDGKVAIYTAGENIENGKMVYLATDNKVYKCDYFDEYVSEYVGITLGNVFSDDKVNVLLEGTKSRSDWDFDLTKKKIFLSSDGELTQEPPQTGVCVECGKIINSDTINLFADGISFVN